MRRSSRTFVPALALAAALAVTGCSDDANDTDDDPAIQDETDDGSLITDPQGVANQLGDDDDDVVNIGEVED